ncbi:MAG TPA: hypothetical protein VMH61_02225 [Candidatus Acidoferrales bacterium]|nr:hypothetical protein [Candidatus Acidoferrales bacterium]
MSARTQRAQGFVELRVEDPEAGSALAVARARLRDAAALADLRRLRLFELAGALPESAAISGLLHASTQFYNPAKERCVVRTSATDAAPLGGGEAMVLVFERGGERRPAAERWWRHEQQRRVEIREGVVWVIAAAPGADARAIAESLAPLRDRAHGLLANPHVQSYRVCAGGPPPLDWIAGASSPPGRRARRSA